MMEGKPCGFAVVAVGVGGATMDLEAVNKFRAWFSIACLLLVETWTLHGMSRFPYDELRAFDRA